MARNKITINTVTKSFSEAGYVLLSKEYINSRTKMKYRCSEGHEHIIMGQDWYQGVRCPTCYTNNNFGVNTPNWQGGISFEPYCEAWKDREFKLDIRERDNNTCQNPDCWCTSDNLVIHHIDYNKQNCHPNNLITVCNSCNSRANKDRHLWQELYMSINNNALSNAE